MIVAHIDKTELESCVITEENIELLQQAVWIDLLSPTKDEENLVETNLGLDIPTRDEMHEIELSRRLYEENGNLFMTAAIMSHSNTQEPLLDPISFVLTKQQVITVRYVSPVTFAIFVEQLKSMDNARRAAPILMVELLEANMNRIADIIENIARELEVYSKAIFTPLSDTKRKPNYLNYMQKIGVNANFTTKIKESLMTFQRLVPFFIDNSSERLNKECTMRLQTMDSDIDALSVHTQFIESKITFLLQATLGMVNIEQNNIIKIFSVVSVIFLPPTLIASIYGMNFHEMPELSWIHGYPYALLLMLLVSWLPYVYFKHRKWL